MSDQDLRAKLRNPEGLDQEGRVNRIRARIRLGEITEEEVILASWCGHKDCAEIIDPRDSLPRFGAWSSWITRTRSIAVEADLVRPREWSEQIRRKVSSIRNSTPNVGRQEDLIWMRVRALVRDKFDTL